MKCIINDLYQAFSLAKRMIGPNHFFRRFLRLVGGWNLKVCRLGLWIFSVLVLAVFTFLHAAPDGNLLKNGDFQQWEKGALKQWGFSSSPPKAEGCILKLSQSGDQGDKQFLKMELSTSAWFVLRQDVKCRPGEKYKFQARYKLFSKSEKAPLKISCGPESGQQPIVVEKSAPPVSSFVSNQWVASEIVFRIPEDSLLTSIAAKIAVMGNGEVWVDYISLENAD